MQQKRIVQKKNSNILEHIIKGTLKAFFNNANMLRVLNIVQSMDFQPP